MIVIMYHYVRERPIGPQWNFKSLDMEIFRLQLSLLQEKFNIVDAVEVTSGRYFERAFDPRDVLLTFDDGFSDHYQFVFKELQSRELNGIFFPPIEPIINRRLLDVHKVHFILACGINVQDLVSRAIQFMSRSGFSNHQVNLMRHTYTQKSALDNADTIFLKRLLQHALPDSLRKELLSELFLLGGLNEDSLVSDFYLTIPQMVEMRNSHMAFGCHGYKHVWLGRESTRNQRRDIVESITFLQDHKLIDSEWFMCYPYGSYNTETIDICKDLGCLGGVTTTPGGYDQRIHSPFEIPRFDIVDFDRFVKLYI